MRKVEELFFRFVMLLSSVIILGLLLFILATIITKGLGSLNLDMLTKLPEGGFYLGKEGGILNAIIGSLYLIGGAIIASIAICIPVVVFMNFYLKTKSRFVAFTRLTFDILFGIPSIVYGAFGFALMIYLGIKASLLGGIIALTMLIIPIMVRSVDEVARMVPSDLREALRALGATKYETSKVLLRQIMPGITTAVLLAIGRGIGDAATVLFTAGYTDSIPTSLNQPVASLPLAIFFQMGSPIEEVQNRAFSAALILTFIILMLSLGGRFFSNKLSKHRI